MTRKWKGYWIKSPLASTTRDTKPAPYLRKTFEYTGDVSDAKIYLCGLGWHELYVNGEKADDRVLAPVVTQFDKRASYIEYDVSSLIRQGKNAIVVLLGNGWYNCQTEEVWNFVNAQWRDGPKLICDVVIGGETVAKSDKSWKCAASPIFFDALRNGEKYDANNEIEGFASPELDDSSWCNAEQGFPPGGIITKEELEPCRVIRTYEPVAVDALYPYVIVYDFGTNLTGWCEIEIEGGVSGSVVTMAYTEQITLSGDPEKGDNATFVKSGDFQNDTYVVKGSGIETYHPRFTYHGFRYVRISLGDMPGSNLKIRSVKACFVHNGFAEAGSFTSSHKVLNRLQELCLQSYRSNFTGIPTDCPHREKNGWTGDASLACELGLWNFDSKKAYHHFARTLADTQRPSGQLPGIAPTAGFGYNWGSGPAWDCCLFELVWNIYRFTGDSEPARELYDNMSLYIAYCEGMMEDYLVNFGLGDWCSYDYRIEPPVELTSSGYVYQDCCRMAAFAKLFGKEEDAKRFGELAANIKASYNKKFYNGDGTYSNASMTANSAALYFGIAEKDQELTIKKIVEELRGRGHRINFGILGAKYTPRVLMDYGYIDDAFEIVTQTEYPGWGNWVVRGATSLWEQWSGRSSHNHVFFGDVSAWMYEYLGGITPTFEAPGFSKIKVAPRFPAKLNDIAMTHQTPYGEIAVSWKRCGDKIEGEVRLPAGIEATLSLPGKEDVKLCAGGSLKFEVV